MVSEGERQCPQCGGRLRYHDSIPRIVKTEGGEKQWIRIRRMICTSCRAVHREIPDTLLPFKHYEANIIQGFVDENLSSFSIGYEDYPSENTVKNWMNEYGKIP